MVAITYAVEVCDESRELRDLLKFLVENKNDEDDIHVLVDSVSDTGVREVLAEFADSISTAEREHDGDFSAHRNFHASLCKGDYIFMIDADEIPQEALIKNIRQFDPKHPLCAAYQHFTWVHRKVPPETQFQGERGRIHQLARLPNALLQKRRFRRVDVKFTKKLTGAEAHVLEANPATALWHVKSVTRQDVQNAFMTL